ncbi:DUF2087 domain-containing protein [Luteipulveratus mongoliensis]|nr:DUF2087 domain-containing protein [Luteipulveratus mongoliensis]
MSTTTPTDPTEPRKRLVVLHLIAQELTPGERYTQVEVDSRIRGLHPDVAALRRQLVDEGFVERRAGEYWRADDSAPPMAS